MLRNQMIPRTVYLPLRAARFRCFPPSPSPLFLSVSPRGGRSLLRRLQMGTGRVIPIKLMINDRAMILKGPAEGFRSPRPRARDPAAHAILR